MTKNNEEKKVKPPSRIRYENTHPVLSFRTTKLWYEKLKAFLGEHEYSIGDFFRIAFKKQKVNYERARTIAFNKGYKIGQNKGHNEGFQEGRKEGYRNGHKIGCEKGYKEGYQAGHKEGLSKGFKDGSEQGFQNGYEKAKQKYLIWYFCDICGQPMLIKANSEDHRSLIDCLRFNGWGHLGCHQKYDRPF